MRRLLIAAGLAVAMTGCVTTSHTPTYVVEFTVTNTSGGTLGASEYPHCGTSELREGYLLVQSPKPKGSALLHVQPRFNGSFAVLGSEGKAFSLSREVHVPDGIDGTQASIVTLALRDGTLRINGDVQSLRFAGSSNAPGLWSAAYVVREGPSKVKEDHGSYSCA